MILIYDSATLAQTLARDLDPHLHNLIERRFASLGELADWTDLLVIEPGDTESDIICEVDFSPLIEPINGGRFGNKGFEPFWDHLTERDGWFELTISFGSTFAYILLIQDADGVLPELRCLCRRYAA